MDQQLRGRHVLIVKKRDGRVENWLERVNKEQKQHKWASVVSGYLKIITKSNA